MGRSASCVTRRGGTVLLPAFYKNSAPPPSGTDARVSMMSQMCNCFLYSYSPQSSLSQTLSFNFQRQHLLKGKPLKAELESHDTFVRTAGLPPRRSTLQTDPLWKRAFVGWVAAGSGDPRSDMRQKSQSTNDEQKKKAPHISSRLTLLFSASSANQATAAKH